MNDFYVDFHCHPTLRALNTLPVNGSRNIWEKTFNNPGLNTPISRWARIQTREIAKESQANFYAYAENNFRIIFDSLYPVEKTWFRFRKMPSYIVSEKAKEEIMLIAFGIEKQRLEYLKRKESYFEELKESYQFLLDGQGASPDGKYKYKVVANYQELQDVMIHHPDTMAVVVNIEGAHGLEAGSPKSLLLSASDHEKLLKENIADLKSWSCPPFFITLAHHFYNQLCGHARSLKPPINLIFDQNHGIDWGMLDMGWVVVEELLSRKNGRRVLLDIKHMSLKSRMQYYQFIMRHNNIYPEDRIPIICSHTGVNGYESMEESLWWKDNGKKFRGSYYNNWSINLSNEEIRIIHDSGGIVGLMMDKGLLAGPDTLKVVRLMVDVEMKKRIFVRMILDNIFSIIKAVGKRSAWDIITIGSDYDGLITHIDCYENVTKIPVLKMDLIQFLHTTQYKKDLWFELKPEEMMNKIFSTNLYQFLQRNFH
jgi:hypothetical protein